MYVWTSNNGTSLALTSYPIVLEKIKKFGGSFITRYIEGKDIDYVAPNPNRKSYAKRLSARG